ncbi:anti-sigma factor [Micromonospora sp. NBC_00362]|uniref:anti-sigma factor n=1 Tax=unclassified Micromonospora TaxID=2617518 RepID=UPI00225BF3DA|nr:anti-sigma factor [Micromonospora sp. NBC_00362]MCX5118394.1 anti-sigma factor [Micromonospora sp. NBC_00362]WTI09440.1 anti-sigma factor [Micromonospora sp. NBC_00821]
MQHLDHDRLVFLALGESEADNGESTHLGTCALCRAEVASLQQVAGLGTETQGLADLPDPPEHVWQGIEAQVRAAEAGPLLTETRRHRVPEQADTTTAEQADTTTAEQTFGAAAEPTVTRLDPTRRSRRGRGWSGWVATAVTAAAAAAVGVVGTVSVLRPDDPTPTPTPVVVASAPLAAYGATPPAAKGDARVFQDGQLHLHVANLPSVPGYYEVWLINPTTMEMFSVGTLGGGPDALLPLPPNVDLKSYSVVDVSAEQYDNNTRHSGDSLLRGSLTG